MSSDISVFKSQLYSIHILEQGINIYSEKFDNFENVDDVLLFGFISALHSYTSSIGKVEVKSIDFGSCKFLFHMLEEGKLLVVIAKADFDAENSSKLIENIKLRYEILTKDKHIEEISSLIDFKERVIPLELVAEIRNRGAKSKPMEVSATLLAPSQKIPDIQVERFYLDSIMGADSLKDEVANNIKKTLSNFFLGYKHILVALFVLVKSEKMVSFIFSRKQIDEVFPLIQKTMNNENITQLTVQKKNSQITKIQIQNQSFWVLTHASTVNPARAIFYSTRKDELEAMIPHLSRILYYVFRLI
ncbi:MAG: hypothetical protein ACTSSG_01970 [Candidatus Heimdallarchaeaceae archaeon]